MSEHPNPNVQALKKKKENRFLSYAKEGLYTASEVPLRGGTHTMIFIKTTGNVTPEDFVKGFTMADYKEITAGLKEAGGDFDIPTFVIPSTMGISKYLRKLNLKDIGLTSANLEDLIMQKTKEGEVASDFLSAAAIEINEAGILANALTFENIVDIEVQASISNPRTFDVDNQFVAIVRQVKINLPLLIGFV